jgi:hypothetical protein
MRDAQHEKDGGLAEAERPVAAVKEQPALERPSPVAYRYDGWSLEPILLSGTK